jgi:hypothetical protein
MFQASKESVENHDNEKLSILQTILLKLTIYNMT